MDLPARVEDALGEESVAASVELGGEDMLYVTPTRTLIYRGQGFLSDDSVSEHAHDAERVELDVGRRKATFHLEYGIEDPTEFSVPADVVDDVLHPVLAGVLNASGVTTSGETALHTHRFSELTLVITSHRVAKHVGSAVWDTEFESVAYEDMTGLALEEGSVASQLAMETADRTQRVKIPQDQAKIVHQRVEEALCDYHGVASYDAFERMVAEETDDAGGDTPAGEGDGFVDTGLDPIETRGSDAADAAPASTQTKGSDPDEEFHADALEAGSTTQPEAPEAPPDRDDDFADSPFESATTQHVDDDVEQRLKALETVIEDQQALLEEQRELLRKLLEDLNRRDR